MYKLYLRSILRRVMTLLVVLSLLSSFLLPVGAAGYTYPQEYWKYHTQYNQAVEQNNKPEILRLGKIIINLLSKDPYADTISNIYNKYSAMADIYQEMEEYDNALYYFKEKLKGAQFLGFEDAVNLTQAKVRAMDFKLQVYAESSDTSKAPYYGAKVEPKNGAYLGRVYTTGDTVAMTDDEAIVSFYVLFKRENLRDFDWFISKFDGADKVLHFAWNLYEENDGLKTVLDPSSDQHIIDTLKYIDSLKSPTMLRIFAEMNVWQKLADPIQYKKAYIKIAELARKYAPDTALVFSPNSISNWSTDINDYYPGDKYVDWVGVSLYSSKYFDVSSPTAKADYSEAYYYNGKYANPIIQLGEIVDRYGERKPIIISEGAAGHKIKATGMDLTSFSGNYIRQVYGYLGMVYPQVKAAIYFDVDLPVSKVNYALSGNNTVKNAFFDILSSNSAINNGLVSSDTVYTKLSTFDEKTDTLNLATYAVIPSEQTTQVEYLLDGFLEGRSSLVPYNISIDTSSLSYGNHKLEVIVKNGKYTKKLVYNLVKNTDGTIKYVAVPSTVVPLTASPTSSKVIVNGKTVAFDAYTISDNNYFKLRDVAYVLSGTDKQFNVGWDGSRNTITLTGGVPYKIIGGEMIKSGGAVKKAVPTASRIMLDGKGSPFTAYTIDGSNYFKLRDIGRAFDFQVDWDGATNTIIIDTSKGYEG
ncbi:MAG: glycosyl hydrolase [Eubacteriales bacterium]